MNKLIDSFKVNFPDGKTYDQYDSMNCFVDGKFSTELFSKNVHINATIDGRDMNVKINNNGSFDINGKFSKGYNTIKVTLTADGINKTLTKTVKYEYQSWRGITLRQRSYSKH